MKLNMWAFSSALGLCWGIAIFIVTWWVILLGGGATGDPTLLGRVYFGYTLSPLGSVIGLAWGAVTAFISGVIFCWLYNFFGTNLFAGSESQLAS